MRYGPARVTVFGTLVALAIEYIAYSIFSTANKDGITLVFAILMAVTLLGLVTSTVWMFKAGGTKSRAMDGERTSVEAKEQPKSLRLIQTIAISLVCAMLAFIVLDMCVILVAGDTAADRLGRGYIYPVVGVFFVIFLPVAWFTGGKLRLLGRRGRQR